jgi:hypothetical protein
MARAYSVSVETANARSSYQDLLKLWQGADQDVPVLKQAEAEYAKIN